MGQSESSIKESRTRESLNHPKFKDIKIIPEEDIIRTTIAIENESDYYSWEAKLNKIEPLIETSLLLPIKYEYKRKAICGSSGIIEIDYDNYHYILADELKNRQKINKHFEEPEIWYLVYSLVSAAHYFENIGYKIGDVRPENIFINEEGHTKVSNLLSWPGEVSNYTKTVFDNEVTYLSPEEAEVAKEGHNESYIDKYKAESFSIGLTLLQSSMIRDIDYLYLPNKTFDSFAFERLIQEWWSLTFRIHNEETNEFSMNEYSDSLKLTIASLCEQSAKNRTESTQIYQWLKAYEKEIQELEPFNAGLPPINNMENYAHFLQRKIIPNKVEKGENNYHHENFKKYSDGHAYGGRTGNQINGNAQLNGRHEYRHENPHHQLKPANHTQKYVESIQNQYQQSNSKPLPTQNLIPTQYQGHQTYQAQKNENQHNFILPNQITNPQEQTKSFQYQQHQKYEQKIEEYQRPKPQPQPQSQPQNYQHYQQPKLVNERIPAQFVLNQRPVSMGSGMTQKQGKPIGPSSGEDFLKQIDEKLMKSRQAFQ